MDLDKISLLYVAPFKDESLNSWVYRLSNAHYCDLKTYFEGRLYLQTPSKSDFDLCSNYETFYELSKFTPIPYNELQSLTLINSNVKNLLGRKFVPWLIPNPKKSFHSFGLQICPECWSKDKVAYHRKLWRLSLLFFCPECKVYMQNCCNYCNYPISYVNPDISKFKEDPLDAIRFCHNCSNNVVGKAANLHKRDEITANRILNLLQSKVKLPCSLEDYLVILHYFTQREFSDYQRRTNRKYIIQTRDRSRFLEVNSIIRADLIAKAFEMFDEFPGIITRTKWNHLSLKAFWLREFVEPPKWYICILNDVRFL